MAVENGAVRLSALTRFFFAEVDARPARWLRVALGALMVAWVLACGPGWTRDYASDGMLSLANVGPTASTGAWFSVLERFDGQVSIDVWWWIMLALSVAYLFGWWPRVASVGLLVIHIALQQRNLWATNAEQTMFRAFLFYGLTLPLVGRAPTMAAWRIRSAQLHVCLIYLVSSPWKWFSDAAWRNGDAMYYVLINPLWSRWPWPALSYHPLAADAMTYGSLALETLYPWLVWVPRLRSPLTVGMIAFHVMLAIVLRHVEFFTLSMACALIVFLRGDEGDRLRALVGRLLAPAQAPRRLRDAVAAKKRWQAADDIY